MGSQYGARRGVADKHQFKFATFSFGNPITRPATVAVADCDCADLGADVMASKSIHIAAFDFIKYRALHLVA
jgi:hypothetical protein